MDEENELMCTYGYKAVASIHEISILVSGCSSISGVFHMVLKLSDRFFIIRFSNDKCVMGWMICNAAERSACIGRCIIIVRISIK